MMQKRSKFEQGFLTAVTILIVIVFMLPVFWLITTSFKFGRDAFAIPPKWLFFDFTLRNYTEVLETSKIGLFLLNSVIISAGTIWLLLNLSGSVSVTGWGSSSSRL